MLLIGGSSSVNGAIALRPLSRDFEAWAVPGGGDWAWPQVLPAFRSIEHDHDRGGPLHGDRGPIPVRRTPAGELLPTQQSFLQACRALGLAFLDDLNDGEAAAGVGLLPTNAVDGLRVSTALAYLAPAVRARPNLQVCGGRRVSRVLFEGRRAVGVETWDDGRTRELGAKRVVLCAGALNTPAILMRSGIGDDAALRALGIATVGHLPGVGRHLIDHPAVMLWMPTRSAEAPRPGHAAQHQVMARAASRAGGPVDLNLFFLAHFPTAKIPMLRQMLGTPLAHALSVVLTTPDSRGQVTLADAAPDALPVVTLNLASTESDVERLMAGVRLAWALARSEPMQALASSVFLWNDSILRSDALLGAAIQRLVSGTWHAVGTARIGAASDPMAVVGPRCAVHGVDRLSVVDASVMPGIPSTPTNLACVMLAERAAKWMRG